ncbi:MAG: N-acetyl-gamma-glutamyl-phosphate reductase [Planctomycetota bacterium]
MSVRVALIGSTGYTALEVARLIDRHPEAELTVATSRSDTGKPLAEVHPALIGRTDLKLETLDPHSVQQRADVAMCCLPHGASAATVRQLADVGLRVVDFSADFRLSTVALYEQWYGPSHPWPERVGKTVYGMPEFFASEIADADVVANPGCYPTSAIMPLAPLVADGLIETTDIIVDSKTGVSGGGRTPKLAMLYCEANESVSAYGVGTHRHGPEIGDLVERISATAVEVVFTPHLIPMDRGILSTIYVSPRPGTGLDQVVSSWNQRFAESPFVQVVKGLPATAHVRGTNQVHMTVRASGNRLVLICAIDNLTKGASGAAVQNMNVMFGLDPRLGLE